MPLEGKKKGILPPLTKIEMEEVEKQDIISLERPGGKLKKERAYLIKDHSSLSKAFSRSILRNMLWVFPFIFLRWLMYSYTIMALSDALIFFKRKLA